MSILGYTKNFNLSPGSVIAGVRKLMPINCGLPQSLVSTISNRYVVTINSKPAGALAENASKLEKPHTIYAYLQEKITFTCASNWGNVGQMFEGITDFSSTVSQSFTQHSFESTIASRRKWTGSEPIKITMKLKFEAIDDVENEVLTPCSALQALTLPRNGLNMMGSSFFLVPPGPSPFKWFKGQERGDEISINVGNFIFFNSVIVTSVEVVYDSRMSNLGPIGADVTLQLESYEMLTKKGLSDVYSTSANSKAQITGTGIEQGMVSTVPPTQ